MRKDNELEQISIKSREKVQNPYLDYLVDLSFEGVIKLFVLSFENNADRTSHKKYFLPSVEMKDYIVIHGQKNVIKTYEKI